MADFTDKPYDIWAVLQAADARLGAIRMRGNIDGTLDGELGEVSRVVRVAAGMAYDLAGEMQRSEEAANG